MAYSKFKQLFLIGEKNPEPKLAVTWKKTCYMARVKGGALSLGSSWSDMAIGVGVTEQRGRLPWGWWPLPHFLPPFSPGLLSHCPFSSKLRATLLLSSFSSSERWASSSRSCGTMQYLYSSAVFVGSLK